MKKDGDIGVFGQHKESENRKETFSRKTALLDTIISNKNRNRW